MGKTIASVVSKGIKGVLFIVSGYMVYRIQGGPPIGKVIKAYKEIKRKEKMEERGIIELYESEFQVA